MPAGVAKKPDTVISKTTHRKVHVGKMEEFKLLVIPFLHPTPGCLYRSMAFDGDLAVIRSGYVNADALLNHLGSLLVQPFWDPRSICLLC